MSDDGLDKMTTEVPRRVAILVWLSVIFRIAVEVTLLTSVAVIFGAPFWIVVPLFALDFLVNGVGQVITKLEHLTEGMKAMVAAIDRRFDEIERPIELPAEAVAAALARYVREISLREQAPNN